MSDLRVNTVSNAAGTGPVTLTGQYAAKAWVNFNGQGTIAIRESFNVTSLTDNGTGDYRVNLTNSMSNSDYGGSAAGRSTGDVAFDSSALNTASVVSVGTFNTSAAFFDISTVVATVHGELA